MIRVIFNDVGDFLEELRDHFRAPTGEEAEYRPHLRLTFMFRYSASDPCVNVRVRAGVRWEAELLILDLDCGSPLRNSPDLDQAKKHARAEVEKLTKAAEELGLRLRGGAYEQSMPLAQ